MNSVFSAQNLVSLFFFISTLSLIPHRMSPSMSAKYLVHMPSSSSRLPISPAGPTSTSNTPMPSCSILLYALFPPLSSSHTFPRWPSSLPLPSARSSLSPPMTKSIFALPVSATKIPSTLVSSALSVFQVSQSSLLLLNHPLLL